MNHNNIIFVRTYTYIRIYTALPQTLNVYPDAFINNILGPKTSKNASIHPTFAKYGWHCV